MQILEEFPWYNDLAAILGTNPALSLKIVSSQPGIDHAANYFQILHIAGSSYSQGLQSSSAQFRGYAPSAHSAAQPQSSPTPAPQYAPAPHSPHYPAPQPHSAPSGTMYGGVGYSAGTLNSIIPLALSTLIISNLALTTPSTILTPMCPPPNLVVPSIPLMMTLIFWTLSAHAFRMTIYFAMMTTVWI